MEDRGREGQETWRTGDVEDMGMRDMWDMRRLTMSSTATNLLLYILPSGLRIHSILAWRGTIARALG